MFGASALCVCVCAQAWCVVLKVKTRTDGITKPPELDNVFLSDVSVVLNMIRSRNARVLQVLTGTLPISHTVAKLVTVNYLKIAAADSVHNETGIWEEATEV